MVTYLALLVLIFVLYSLHQSIERNTDRIIETIRLDLKYREKIEKLNEVNYHDDDY